MAVASAPPTFVIQVIEEGRHHLIGRKLVDPDGVHQMPHIAIAQPQALGLSLGLPTGSLLVTFTHVDDEDVTHACHQVVDPRMPPLSNRAPPRPWW